MVDRTRRVILLIDYDNLQICASRDTPGRDLQLEPVVQLAQRFGTVMVARAYAEWNLSTERLAVYKAGIEPAFAPILRTESDRTGKSLADTVMVAEGMDMLWTLGPDVLVLATSDKDLIPLARAARQRGARLIVLGSDFTAVPLREMADEHYTYKQLITEGPTRLTEPTSARPAITIPEGGGRRQHSTRERERERERERDREQRAAPAPAPERAAPAAQAPASAATTSPVPPVESAGEGEGALAGRRRRRRGSRRRLERLAQGDSDEGQAEDGEEQRDEAAEGATEGSNGAVFQASDGEVEVPATAAPPEPTAAAPGVNGSAEAPAAPEPAAPLTEAPGAVEAAAPPQVEPAPEEGQGAPGETEGETAEAPRRTRARRVASATRGRSRPSTR